MQVIVTTKAKSNLLEVFNYNVKISLKYAIETDKKIRSSIDKLQNFPYIGRYVPEIPNKYYRERVCENYRIIYIVSEKLNTVFIRYIISGKQNSNLFFEVHKKEIFNFYLKNLI